MVWNICDIHLVVSHGLVYTFLAIFDLFVKRICIDSVMNSKHILSNSKEKRKKKKAKNKKKRK